MVIKSKKYEDRGIFFRVKNEYIISKVWKELPKSSKSIFPVIAVHCNKKGIAFPSQETISKLSGCTPKTVRNGLKGLEEFHDFKISQEVNAKGQIKNIYHIKLPKKNDKEVFFFHKTIIESGKWSKISQSAKALYPVIRAYSYCDFKSYQMLMCEEDTFYDGDGMSAGERLDHYGKRDFNLNASDFSVLSDFSGITLQSVYNAINSLKKHGLLEEITTNQKRRIFKVLYNPKRYVHGSMKWKVIEYARRRLER